MVRIPNWQFVLDLQGQQASHDSDWKTSKTDILDPPHTHTPVGTLVWGLKVKLRWTDLLEGCHGARGEKSVATSEENRGNEEK